MPAKSEPGAPSPLTARNGGGATLAVRVTPRASRTGIEGVVLDAAGQAQLKIAVTVVAEDGKANAAVIALLAKTLGVAKSRMSIVTGATDRRKVLQIDGDFDTLRSALTQATLNL